MAEPMLQEVGVIVVTVYRRDLQTLSQIYVQGESYIILQSRHTLYADMVPHAMNDPNCPSKQTSSHGLRLHRHMEAKVALALSQLS
jgi:hypothetical protein